MNSYSEPIRVGVAGATGYTGVELLRLLARHPAVRLTAAMGGPGAPARRVPALARVWDDVVEGLDVDVLSERADAIFLALPDTAAAEVAPALLTRGRRRIEAVG